MAALVDAVYAGGPVTVDVVELPATGERVVAIRMPTADTPWSVDDARKLAVAILAAAADAERKEATPWP